MIPKDKVPVDKLPDRARDALQRANELQQVDIPELRQRLQLLEAEQRYLRLLADIEYKDDEDDENSEES